MKVARRGGGVQTKVDSKKVMMVDGQERRSGERRAFKPARVNTTQIKARLVTGRCRKRYRWLSAKKRSKLAEPAEMSSVGERVRGGKE